ncbi:hypothetical protein Tco_0809745 [Tanacetum coccineum]
MNSVAQELGTELEKPQELEREITLKLDLKSANNGYGSPFVKISAVCRHVYSTAIITVDQGRCEKWGMKLTKEVANPRCLSYSIRNPAYIGKDEIVDVGNDDDLIDDDVDDDVNDGEMLDVDIV